MTHRVYVSRHVQFYESTFPYHGVSVQNLQTNIDYTHFFECLNHVFSSSNIGSSHSFSSSPCLACSDSPIHTYPQILSLICKVLFLWNPFRIL